MDISWYHNIGSLYFNGGDLEGKSKPILLAVSFFYVILLTKLCCVLIRIEVELRGELK